MAMKWLHGCSRMCHNRCELSSTLCASSPLQELVLRNILIAVMNIGKTIFEIDVSYYCSLLLNVQ